MKLDYIPNDFGRTWVQSHAEARRGVHLPLSYIDINEGNLNDAIVFAQIMYWHEPSAETGLSRLVIQHDGHYWLAKNHCDWYAETRVKARTIRNCLSRLQERNLIIYELNGFAGNVTPHLRINWDEFERRMRHWTTHADAYSQDSTPDIRCQTPDTRGQGGLTPDVRPLTLDVKSNTETTTETTTEIISDNGLPTVGRVFRRVPRTRGLTVPVDAVTGPVAKNDPQMPRAGFIILDVLNKKSLSPNQMTLLSEPVVIAEKTYSSLIDLCKQDENRFRAYIEHIRDWMREKRIAQSYVLNQAIHFARGYADKERGWFDFNKTSNPSALCGDQSPRAKRFFSR
jgi:hypothetical protein